MMKQIILPLAAVMIFIIAVGLFLKKTATLNLNIAETGQAAPKVVVVSGKEVKVEIADTQEKRQLGLSGRTSLGENTGMLFVFNPQNANPIFWMKDTLIPLDFIWINDSKVVKIDANVQPPKAGTPDSQLTHYQSDTPVDYVLEVPGGFTSTNKTTVGDLVDLSKI